MHMRFICTAPLGALVRQRRQLQHRRGGSGRRRAVTHQKSTQDQALPPQFTHIESRLAISATRSRFSDGAISYTWGIHRAHLCAVPYQRRQLRHRGGDKPRRGAVGRQEPAEYRRQRGGLAGAAGAARQAPLHTPLQCAAAQQHLRICSQGYYDLLGTLDLA